MKRSAEESRPGRQARRRARRVGNAGKEAHVGGAEKELLAKKIPDLPAPAVSLLWVVAAILTFWSFGFTVMQGSDLWWHVAGGRWMVEHHTLAVADPFSFTAAGRPWLNDAWLSDVALHLWAAAFGIQTLVFWKWAVLVGTWLLLFRLVARMGGDDTAAFLATLLGLAVAAPFLDLRPQLHTFLAWVLLLGLTLGRERPSAWLPGLFLLWANLHAGFVLGLAMLPILLLPSLAPRERRRTLFLAVASGLACLANPNGPGVLLRPLRYAFDSTSPFRILAEWQPALSNSAIQSPMLPYAIAAFALAVVIGAAGRTAVRDRGVFWTATAAGGITLAMALRSCRFVPFFAMTQSLVVGPVLAALLVPMLGRIPRAAPAAAAALVGFVWLRVFPLGPEAFHFLAAEYVLPVATVDFMEANGLTGNVFNWYNWGGYLHERTNGRLKVFVDGRAGTVYPDDIFRRYLQVFYERPGWQEAIDESGADYVLWTKSRIPAELVKTGRWRAIHADYNSYLLARSDRRFEQPLVEAPDSAFRQLALGRSAFDGGRNAEAQAHFRRALDLMPYLQPACEQLARSQAVAGDVDGGWSTFESCQRIFPEPAKRAVFQRFVAAAGKSRTGRGKRSGRRGGSGGPG